MSPIKGRPLLAVDAETCRACKKCLGARICPGKAIRNIDPGEPPYIETTVCQGCLACVRACPVGAIINQSDANGSR